MEATTEEKFDAAVKVIQSIPRNVSIRDVIRLGAFQPSSSLLLRFYGYYKQATMGPCDIPRPAFYDMMGKAKWDAWNKLGNMSKEEAMNCYVEELKNIIEAMPHTDKVSAFISKLGDFYELVDEKIGEDYRRIKPALHLNGDVKNRDNDSDPEDIMTKITNETDVSTELQLQVYSTECDNQSDIVNNKQLTVTSHNNTTGGDDDDGVGDDEDSETDEFCDTLDSPTESELINPVSCGSDHTYSAAPVTMVTALPHGVSSTSQLYDKNWSSMETQTKLADTFTIGEKDLIDDVKSTPSTSIGSNSNTPSHVKAVSSKASPVSVAGSSSRVKGHILNQRASDVSEQLAVTVKCLQDDMKQVTRRLEVLEKYYKSRQSQRQRYWWPFGNLPAKAAIFFIVWPFIVHWLLFRKRSR